MAGNFEPATKFFTSRGRLEKQKQNEYSNKGNKHINHILTDVKYSLESFCDATNLSASLFSFIAAIIIFDRFPKFAEPNKMHGAVLLEMVKSLLIWLVSSKANLQLPLFPAVKKEMSKLPWSLVDFQGRHLKQYYVVKANSLHAAKTTGSLLYTRPNQLLQKLTRNTFETMSQKEPSHACGLRCVIRNKGKYSETIYDTSLWEFCLLYSSKIGRVKQKHSQISVCRSQPTGMTNLFLFIPEQTFEIDWYIHKKLKRQNQ